MLIEDGMSQMDAIKKVAKLRKVPKSEIYNQYHK
jgi:16S rRNA C1402 (ribose-2'-O) methylase RsmI